MLTYAHTAELLLLELLTTATTTTSSPTTSPPCVLFRPVPLRPRLCRRDRYQGCYYAVNAMGAYGVCDEYQAERFLRDAAVAPNIEVPATSST